MQTNAVSVSRQTQTNAVRRRREGTTTRQTKEEHAVVARYKNKYLTSKWVACDLAEAGDLLTAMAQNVWFAPRLTVDRWIARLQANEPSFTALFSRSSLRSIEERQLIALASAVETNTTVETLHLSGMKLTPAANDAFATALATNRTVKHLCVGDSAWGDDGAPRFLEALLAAVTASGRPSPLVRLDLELKGLTGACVPSLVTLATNTNFASLSELLLSRNALGDAGVQTLCDGLVAASAVAPLRLRVLDLSQNEIGPAGAIALGNALPILPLVSLSLTDNVVGPAGATALAAGVMRCTSLTALRLASAGVGTDGAVGTRALEPANIVGRWQLTPCPKSTFGCVRCRSAGGRDEPAPGAGGVGSERLRHHRGGGRRLWRVPGIQPVLARAGIGQQRARRRRRRGPCPRPGAASAAHPPGPALQQHRPRYGYGLAGQPMRCRLLMPDACALVRIAVALKTALRPSAARARRG